MSAAEARPAPLRVPVSDVTMRNSIVGRARRSREVLDPSMIVVQRAVRIISDPPSAASPSEAPEALLSKSIAAAHAHAASGHAFDSQRAGGVQADSLELDDEEREQEDAFFDSLAPPNKPSSSREEREPEPSSAGLSSQEEDDDEPAELLDVSVPPPAPPEALRRSSSNPAAPRSDSPVRPDAPAEVEVLPERAAEPDRQSGEIEELDLESEAEGRVVSVEPARLPRPPPPPPPLRPSIPEPPDLSTLTRSARVQELRPTKPRSHAWWEVFFDDDYLRTVRAPTRSQIAKQCDFIEKRLGLKPGATLLDVACGLGQHVIELSARGYASVGVDLSLAMLSRASEEAQSRNMRINFLHADMRDLSFEANFDAVTCLGTSLGYFDDETNKKVMERLLRALKPGGVLLLDVVNRDHVIRSQPNLIWFEGEGCVCMEESEFNFFTSRLHVKRTVILDTGKQLENEYSLRLYSLHELGQLLNASGFRVSEVSGRDALPGVFFGQESPNLMIVAERRPDAGAPASTSGDDKG
ncbi:MAG: Methyltransferase [Myxococcaceae bacterium]|nr:Methyltransferase [Myxococcaceae bacterium]